MNFDPVILSEIKTKEQVKKGKTTTFIFVVEYQSMFVLRVGFSYWWYLKCLKRKHQYGNLPTILGVFAVNDNALFRDNASLLNNQWI